MRNAMIYVRHEPLAHLFLTYGISASDLLSDHLKVPKHLLLLPPVDEQEQIDPHTWFNIIDGADQVQDFLRSKAAQTRCWLDYSSPRFLQELTPNEIAELLYLGHAKTHLSSPFYYKLQNELVYLPLRNGMVNMYLRNESLFATFLANAINKYMRRIANEEPFWLRLRQQHFSRVSHAVYTQFLPLLEDGVVFDFRNVRFSREKISVPLLAPKARFVPDGILTDTDVRRLGMLVLMRQKNQWMMIDDAASADHRQ